MTKEIQPFIWLTLLLVWFGTIFAAGVILFYRYPKRLAFAAAVGIATTFVMVLGILLGLAPSDARSLGFSVLLGILAFLISLLWLWLTPALQRKGWDDIVASTKKEIEESRKGQRG